MSNIDNWISYLEKYRADKLLYQMHISEIKKVSGLRVSSYIVSVVSPDVVEKLKNSVDTAEKHLENYIVSNDPQEVARQADEKLFLSYRYLCGMTMSETAAAMCVSRDTVYRIRRRVLRRRLPADLL